MQDRILSVEELLALDRPLTVDEVSRIQLYDRHEGWFVGPGAWANDD